MKNEKIIRSVGNISDKFIEEAMPQKNISLRKSVFRYLSVAASVAIIFFVNTVFAANYIENRIKSFYLRYLSPQETAVADSLAEQYGANIYFEGLKSDDLYTQYFSINKLVEYYNDDEIREKSIKVITPFLSSEDEKISDAAAFALSILKKEFGDSRIIRMADEVIVFTLFNDYSDYGTYNKIWIIKNDELIEYMSFERPKMYITEMIPSSDKKLLAVTFASNKSEYVEIFDLENNMVSPELIDSARIMLSQKLGLTFWQQANFENYSGISETFGIRWTDNKSIEFQAYLSYDGGEMVTNASVKYDFREKNMVVSIIDE